jgi:hypothetical protein
MEEEYSNKKSVDCLEKAKQRKEAFEVRRLGAGEGYWKRINTTRMRRGPKRGR